MGIHPKSNVIPSHWDIEFSATFLGSNIFATLRKWTFKKRRINLIYPEIFVSK
jgi:hypothetical protein